MNPSYDSSGQNAAGNSGIPGVKPGVIASGPDTPEASVPGVANSLGGLSVGGNSQNPNGVFGRLSRIPGGSRPNSSSSNGFNNGNTGPITPQSIDKIIIDGGGGPKRSKRGLLVAGIVLIGVALVVGVVALVVMNNGGGGKTVSTETAFYNVARYMLFGDIESKGMITEVELKDTAFMQMLQNSIYEEQRTYFSKANEYMGVLVNATKNGQMAEQASEIAQNTAFMTNLSEAAYTDVFWQKYLEGGAEGVQSYVNEINGLAVVENMSDNMIDTIQGLATNTAKIYKIYFDADCVTDDEVNTDCVNNVVEDNGALSSLTRETSRLRIKTRDYVGMLANRVYEIIMIMNAGLGNE